MKTDKTTIIIPLIFPLLFCACLTDNSKGQKSYTDARQWINRPPYNFSGEELEYTIISREYEEQYISLLADKTFCIVNQDEYQSLTNEKLEKKYAVAIRAVYTNIGGSYKVIQDEAGEILVKYYVLGNGTNLHKSILLLGLNKLPNTIYISYTSAR
jgi:hypothetical protein